MHSKAITHKVKRKKRLTSDINHISTRSSATSDSPLATTCGYRLSMLLSFCLIFTVPLHGLQCILNDSVTLFCTFLFTCLLMKARIDHKIALLSYSMIRSSKTSYLVEILSACTSVRQLRISLPSYLSVKASIFCFWFCVMISKLMWNTGM